MNFRRLLFVFLLTVALVSAAPIAEDQVEETEQTVEQTLPELEQTTEITEDIDDKPLKRETSESITEEPTTESTDDAAGRKAFNAELVNVMIDAVDGAVDVAVGAVTGAVDVALGTVTGAANLAAGTVNGAVGVLSSTVDGTLNIISTTVNKGPRPPAIRPPAVQIAYPTRPLYATPMAQPAQPIQSLPAAPQEQTNIVGTPTGPVVSNAIARDMNEQNDEIITAEQSPMTDSITVGASMSFEEPIPSTKPAVIDSVPVGPTEEATNVEPDTSNFTPMAAPIIVETSPIIKSIVMEEVETTEANFALITAAETADETMMPQDAPKTETGFTPIESRAEEIADETPVPETTEETAVNADEFTPIESRTTAEETIDVDEATAPETEPTKEEVMVPQADDAEITPVVSRINKDEEIVEASAPETAPMTVETADEEVSEMASDDIVREKRHDCAHHEEHKADHEHNHDEEQEHAESHECPDHTHE